MLRRYLREEVVSDAKQHFANSVDVGLLPEILLNKKDPSLPLSKMFPVKTGQGKDDLWKPDANAVSGFEDR
jgi:hypothetical protein